MIHFREYADRIAAGQNNMQVVHGNTSMHKEFIKECLREVLREGEFRDNSTRTSQVTNLEAEAAVERVGGMRRPGQQSSDENISDINGAGSETGRSDSFPTNVFLPDELGSMMQAWNLWFCGNGTKKIPMLRSVDPSVLHTKNCKKRLSDVKYLVKCFEQHVRRILANQDQDTREEVQRRLENLQRGGGPVDIRLTECREIFVMYQDSFFAWLNAGRSRRKGQLKWNTLVKKLRERGE
ncbi:hypothetical protein GUITHDRAFT_154555 [Guillardia theta CCMP2712]|uniref:Uncharacterized protein n=1 Tax=Guillardia theta (strain CCMP2712) TaxID=905079 RepID=L1IT77_GUITC|nr:hypothetical protein GUITHDRAFT_154555 [Guillardia theta CCMP2712]EKX39045.1 hypothetical protein GUITHDRAFT_154555 [Guillardia theta CCMP2712]|eukprot:XP_005826025.1 hypothetical protein GUITHDRAFT_154555 [Guillardia theta CCMP2712]